jgi:TetR/AcrR family transcriptional repressor of nem operon
MKSKSFDPNDALDASLQVFWQGGFGGTPMPDLLKGMELGRASFYNAFKSKRLVFLAALDLYISKVDAGLADLAKDVTTRREAVEAILGAIFQLARSGNVWRGCFLGNTALELGHDDKEISVRLKRGIELLQKRIAAALSKPASDGSHLSPAQRDQYALFLVAGIQGLLVLAKGGLPQKAIDDIASTLIEAIP